MVIVLFIILILVIILTILSIIILCRDDRPIFVRGICIGVFVTFLTVCCISLHSKTTRIKSKTFPEIETTVTYGVNYNDTTYTYIFNKD